jgi:hypothetical protein
MKKTGKYKIMTAASIAALVGGVGLAAAPGANAAVCSTTAVTGANANCTTPVNLTVNSVLSLAGGDDSITIPAITPGASAVAAEKAGTAMKILSNNPSGYNFTAYASNTKSGDTSAGLADGTATTAHVIPTANGSSTAASSITANGWGISATAATTTGAVGAYGNYKAMGTSASKITLLSPTGPSYSAGDQVQVKYGANINMSQAAGTYTGTVTYTLTAKS